MYHCYFVFEFTLLYLEATSDTEYWQVPLAFLVLCCWSVSIRTLNLGNGEMVLELSYRYL